MGKASRRKRQAAAKPQPKKNDKRLMWFLVVISLFFVAFVVYQTTRTAPSNTALPGKNIQLQTLDGRTTSLAEYSGKVIILDFWATWCPPCRREIPGYIRLYQRYRDRGLVIIGATYESGSVSDIQQFAMGIGINYPLVLGTRSLMQAYGGVRAFPTTFVIDRKGKVQRRYEGYRPESTFEKDILDLL